jgi:hypothetical protein
MGQEDTNGAQMICKLPCPLLISKEVSEKARWIFGVIWAYYEATGEPVVITNDVIRRTLGISERVVSSAITTLEDKGMLTIERGRKRKMVPNSTYEWKAEEWERVCRIFSGREQLPCDEDNTLYELKRVPDEVVQICTYWNTKINLIPVKIPNKIGDMFEMTPYFTDLVRLIKKLLDGKLFNESKAYRFHHDRPWTVEEVKESIDNFQLAATCDDYYPMDKAACLKKTLASFIFNPYIKNPGWRSALVMYVDPPKPFYYRVKAEATKSMSLYHALRQEYSNVYPNKFDSKEDDMKIIVASNRLSEWVDRHKKYLPSMPMSSMWASYTLEALIELIQGRGKAQYEPLDTIRKDWYWDYFTRFMQKKGLLSTYSLK